MAQLQTAAEHYAAQRRVVILAAAAAHHAWAAHRPDALGRTLATLMTRAAANGASSVADMVAEQGIEAPAAGQIVISAFARTATDGRDLSTLLEQAESEAQLVLMALTQVADAGRVAQSVETAIRPALTTYTRYVNPPACGRCAILAGRVYRWSSGFLRHPRCDCVMVPSTSAAAPHLIADPYALFDDGKVRGLSRADERAIRDGADPTKVVNAHRFMQTADVFGRRAKITREAITRRSDVGRRLAAKGQNAVRLMPESIYRIAASRDDAIRLLRLHGYIT